MKGMNEHHDTMQISEAPIAYDDLQEAYQRLLDGAGSDQVFDAKEGDERVRRYLYSLLTACTVMTGAAAVITAIRRMRRT